MSGPTIRVGVIGVGVMGERHVRTYADMAGVTFAGVCDPDQRRAENVVAQFGGKVYPSAEHLLDDVDAVTIASPTRFHARLALTAIHRDKHVMIEKPLAQTVSEANEIVAALKRHRGLVVNVGHIERFNPVVQTLRDHVSDRRVERATFRRTTPFHGRCLDTDVIADLMIHDIDLSLSFFGSPAGPIRSVGEIRLTGKIDEATARYTSIASTEVTLIASRVAPFKERMIEVLTDDQWIVADLLAKTITTTSFGQPPTRNRPPDHGHQVTVVTDGADALRSELQHFIDCARTGMASPVGTSAGLAAMQISESVRQNIPGLGIEPSLDRTGIHA